MKGSFVGAGCIGPSITDSGPVCRHGLYADRERPDCEACREAAMEAYHEAMDIYADIHRRRGEDPWE